MTSPRTARTDRPSLVDPVRSRRVARSVVLDVVAVLVFVAIGRRNHGEDAAVASVASTAAPFLAGLLAGWLAVVYGRHDPASPRAGAVVAVATVGLGMLARHVLDLGGTPPVFVAVAAGVVTALMLGWRLGARLLGGR